MITRRVDMISRTGCMIIYREGMSAGDGGMITCRKSMITQPDEILNGAAGRTFGLFAASFGARLVRFGAFAHTIGALNACLRALCWIFGAVRLRK